jgi:transposase-like protein
VAILVSGDLLDELIAGDRLKIKRRCLIERGMEESKMQCPECKSSHIRKNDINKKGKQNHICVPGGRQFIDNDENHRY